MLVFALMKVRSALLVTAFVVAACGSDTPEPKSPGDAHSTPPEDLHHRVVLTRRLLEDNKLTPEDVAELQLFLRGRVILRRETTAGAREITKQHTLKVVDGRSYDEVVIENGTPGVSRANDELRVNFDPDDAQSGLVFSTEDDGKYKLSVDRKHGESAFYTPYANERYEVVEGMGAYLEIEEEQLHAYVTHQRKLPGTLLPGAAGSSAPSASAPAPDAPPDKKGGAP